MPLLSPADRVLRSVQDAGQGVSELLFEPVTRLGVTGLARAGKTVFITGLVNNLTAGTRMGQLASVAEGRFETAYLQPQPDDTIPRFAYEAHRGLLLADPPRWPDSTRSISQLRLSIRSRDPGMLGALRGTRVSHLDIVDYPGEWLLDLALLDLTYAQWSARTLKAMADRPQIGLAWRAAVQGVDASAALDENKAQELAKAFTSYLSDCRAAGLANVTPGRFLLPGDLEGSPVLTFAPLPPMQAPQGSLHRAFERRYEAYRREVVQPFFRNHFARIDRQVVLVDLLAALDAGPAGLQDLQTALAGVLGAFRPGRNTWLSRILGKRVDRILFAATKADHLHHVQHDRLAALLKALVEEAAAKAKFSGAQVEAMAIASLRATAEQEVAHGGQPLAMVRGQRLSDRKTVALHPGSLPNDPTALLRKAEAGESWDETEFTALPFAPPTLLDSARGLPHIRLDRAAQFLFGDRI
jgi:predicted YcjX-like family ATPase